MNTKLLSPLLFAFALAATAQEQPASYNSSILGFEPLRWNPQMDHWDRIISESRTLSELRLGTSDFGVSGPLISGIRGERISADSSLGQRMLSLPVVSWIVPQKMPSPPGGTGSYFAWRGSRRPWSATTPASAPGSAFNPFENEPRTSLISIGQRDR